jgi:CRP/FNR family transcriptional regulator
VLREFALPRLSGTGAAPDPDIAALHAMAGLAIGHARQGVIRHQGEPPHAVYLLVEGWAGSAITLPSGERQIVQLHLPGDLVGTPSLCLKEAAESLFALTQVQVRKIPAARFAELFASSPEFASRMFLSAQRERIALMDRLIAIGARPAAGRIAALLLDVHDRLAKIAHVRDGEFVLRMTQDEIGDYLGLTSVHVNRMFKQLVAQGLIERRLQRVRLRDISRLKALSGYIERELDPGCAALFTPAGK